MGNKREPSMSDSITLRAVVTGCNKGVGYYIAQQLVARGIQVIAACRNPTLGEQAASELGAEFVPLDLASPDSISQFVDTVRTKFETIDILVNNGAIAFKAADPTPFAGQTSPTLAINYWGTVQLTDQMLPLLRQAADRRKHTSWIVNVASMAGKLRQVSPELQQRFCSETLDRDELTTLMRRFEEAAQVGDHRELGFSNSNYGMSKLGLIAYTKMVAREEPQLRVNCCCPGYCDTDMSSHGGTRHPNDGANNATMLVGVPDTGIFIRDEKKSVW